MDAGTAGQLSLGVLAGIVIVALLFDFMNGFHDAANSIATVVSTGVLKPYQAVVLAAFFNFVAVFVFHLSVATTVGKGIVDQGIVDHHLVLGALIGAISWNIITWYYGIPSSSSHALIGGIVGAGVAKAGIWALIPAGLLKTVAFIFISPLMGFVIGSLLLLTISWLFVRSTPSRVDRLFRRLHRRGWIDAFGVRGAMGHRGHHRLGVDPDHTVHRVHRRPRLVARPRGSQLEPVTQQTFLAVEG